MSLDEKEIQKWHADEELWWNKNGEYMTYQWKLTPFMNKIIRTKMEKDYKKFLYCSNEYLLDLGCGSGWLSIYFADRGMKVMGVDISKKQIDAANKFKKEANIKNLSFECADLMNWDSKKYKAKFDSVFVNAFLHHLPEIELGILIEKIEVVLKPGGKVYMYEPLKSNSVRIKMSAKIIDFFPNIILHFLLNFLPRHINIISERHRKELLNGYQMSSPHEHPIDIDLIRNYCSKYFDILEVKGWHLHSLGFAMQIMGFKDFVRNIYSKLIRFWYLIDKMLFKIFGWEQFSQPERFILCSIKMRKKKL